MHYQTVVADVNNIVEKYYRVKEEYYTRHRYDENYAGVIFMDDELREYFDDNSIAYDISFEEGFDSPGYAIDFIAIAFEHEGNLYLRTEVFENC